MPDSVLRPETQTRLFYEENVRQYGYDHRGLGFRTRSSQEKRFEALLGIGELDRRFVLDVGCGFGDFLAFLLGRGIRPVYTGLDICAPMIVRCHERFAVSEGIFACGDVLKYQPHARYDYVVASGIFGFEAPGAFDRIQPTLERMFGWAKVGVSVNFLSARAVSKAQNRLYVDPAQALEWGLALTPSARIDHTYLPNDFTLHLYKEPAWIDATGDTQ
jgi:SAM-dependent methyltransferase